MQPAQSSVAAIGSSGSAERASRFSGGSSLFEEFQQFRQTTPSGTHPSVGLDNPELPRCQRAEENTGNMKIKEGELSSSARPGDRRALGAAMLFFDDNEENTFIGSGAAVSDSQAVFRSTQGAPDSELESNPVLSASVKFSPARNFNSSAERERNSGTTARKRTQHEAAMEDALGLVNRNRNDEFLDNRGSGEYSAFPSKLLHNSAKTEPLNLPSAIWFNDVQDREDAGTSRETDSNPIAQAQRVLVDEDSKGTNCTTGVASEAHYEPPVQRETFPTAQEAPAELRERRAQRLKYFRGRGSNRQSLFDAPLFGSPVFGRFQAYETSGLQAPARLVNGIVFTAPGQTFEKLKAEQETELGFQHVPNVEYFDRALHDKEALKRRKAREERRKNQWSPLTPLARFPRPPGVVHKKPASERELQVRERQKLMQKLGPNLDKVLRADAGASTSPVTIHLPGGHLREVNVDGSPSDWGSWSPTASREKRRGFVVSPRQGLGAVNGGPHQGLGGSAAPHSPTSSQFSFSPAVSRVRRLGQAVQNVGPEVKTMQETTTSARQMERLIADFSGANMDNDLEDVVSADVAAATRKDRAPAFLGPQVRYEDTASSGTTGAGRIAPEMIVKDARLAPLRGSLMHPEARGGDTGEQPKPGDTTNSLVPADERRCSAWPLQKQAASFQRDHLDVLADLEKTLETARLGAKSVVWQKRKRLKMRSAVTHVTEHPYAEERVFVATENGNWGLIRLFSAEAEVEEAPTDDPSVGGEAEVFCQRAHQRALTSIAAHRRGLRLVTTGKDRYMHVWAVDDCTVPLSTTITPHLTHASACHDFSDFFATADGDGLVRVYDLNRGVTTNMPPSVTIRGHTECVESVCFQNFGNEILTAAQDGMASIFDMRSGLCVATFGHFSMINGEQRSRRRSKQECVASGGRSRSPGGSLSPRVAPFAGSQIVSSAVYSPDNSMILTAEERGVCRLWDRRKGGKQAGPCSDELLRIDCRSGGGDPVLSAAFDTTGDTISVCCPSEVLVFSLADGGFTQAIGSASRHAFFTDACFTRENRTLVAAYSGGLVLCDGVVDA